MRDKQVLVNHASPGGVATGMPLLRSKLVAPELPETFVDRPRLTGLLTAGARGPVTLVAAPAGWGKTVLLSQWARVDGGAPVGWLSVEPGDEASFWSYVRAALDAVDVPVPAPAAAPGRFFLPRLADTLAHLPRPVVLVLDDLHHIRAADVLAGLEFLLRHAGAGLRLAIGTRPDPALPLHRWRLTGELTEIRARTLAFTPAETAELLARHGLALPAPDLHDLHARTEGWAAGLRLAALSRRGQPDPPGAGGVEPGIATYLTEEVLAAQPDEVRDALLCGAVLERLTGPLVDVLTGRGDGERILTELAGGNGFLVPLGTGTGGYRYHRMLREVLRGELRRRSPERIPELHRRAARWHATQGSPMEALRHALAARDWRHATGVLAEHWHDLMLPGHPDSGAGPGRAFAAPPPAHIVDGDPELALAYAVDRMDQRDLDSAVQYLDLAERRVHLLAGERRDRLALMSAALRLAQAQLTGDAATACSAAPRMLALLDDAPGGRSDQAARAIALAALGAAHLAAGDPGPAEEALTAGLAEAELSGLACLRLVCASRLAFVRAARGGLREAERTAREALDLPACPDRSRYVHRGYAHLALALVNLERDRLDDAAGSLALAVRGGDAAVEPALHASIVLARVHVLREQGDLAGSYRALLTGRRELGRWRLPAQVEHVFAAAEADLRTAHGDPESARELLAAIPSVRSAAVAVALARAHLRAGDAASALRALPAWAADSTGPPQLAIRLDAGLLEAVAARRSGDPRRAARALERVLELAEPEGFLRVFARSGPAGRQLLADHLDSGTAYWFWVSELVAAAGARPAAEEPPPPALGEPLTEREMTVLRYLQSILSTVEIAAELCLSVNTVKTHIRNIYRKLAATRRRDAVRRARELRLL